MTIRDCAAQLRQEANARGGSTLLLWAADTLEAMHKALAEAEYQTDCMHCKHRGAADSRACMECDIQCDKCTSPCPCRSCTGGSEWEWRANDENRHP